MTRKPTGHNRAVSNRTSHQTHATQTFIEHVRELRRRFYIVALSIVAWGCLAYAFEQHIVNVLLKPARGEHFIYTSPGGGIDFLFRICMYAGIVASLPVILYNLLRFIEPLITKASTLFIVSVSIVSGLLAIGGMMFGYFIGLPAALHFLLHQFTTVQIKPLVTIQSYLAFVIVYMVGSAVLFQLPLLLICINRIKPLKPSRLLRYERWVILAAFVLAGLMNPTPNILSQLLIAGPLIVMYQIGILIIALINRSHRTPASARVAQTVDPQAVHHKPVVPPKPAFRAGRHMEPVMRRAVTVQPTVQIARPTSSLGLTAATMPRLRTRQEIYAMRGTPSRTLNDVQPVFSRQRLIA